MKIAANLLAAIALAATLAHAQNPPIQHVIVIVQENRSPDNLFGVDAATHQKLPNAHLATYGLCKPIGYSSSQQVNLTSFKLAACWDPDHSHVPAWDTMWDYGRMDGACATNVSSAQTTSASVSSSSPGVAIHSGTRIAHSTPTLKILR